MVEQLGVAEHTARVLEELGDAAGLAFALSFQAHMLRETGHAEAALHVALRGAELAARGGDRDCEATCRRMAAYCAAFGPTPVREAVALCEAAEATRDEKRPLSVADALAWLLAQLGHITEARDLYERELGLLRQRGIVLNLTVGMARAALVERAAGDLGRAAAHLRTAYAVERAQDVRGDVPAVAGELACVLALRGEHEEAARLAHESRTLLAPGDVLAAVLWRRALAVVAAHEGRHEESLRLSHEAREHAECTDWLTFRGETLEEAAHVRRLAGDGAGEPEALHAALALYERKGNLSGARRVRSMLTRSDRRI